MAVSTRPTGVRLLAFAVATLCAALACAQTPESQIQAAFDKIRGQRSLFMRLDGTEQIGSDQHHILVDAFWDTAPSGDKTISRVQVIGYKDDVMRYRAVGDGTNLWNYDVTNSEYSVQLYGSYTSKQPDDYQQLLLQSLVAASRGASIFPARMLRDVYGGAAATFKTWTPGTDATQTGTLITYAAGNPLTRQVTFLLDQTGGLISMSYLDVKGDEQVSWTLNFYSFLSPPPDWDFDFAPPEGAKPITQVTHG